MRVVPVQPPSREVQVGNSITNPVASPNFLDQSEILQTARTGRAADLRKTLKTKARQSLYWTAKALFNYNRLTQGFHLPLCQHIQSTQGDLRRVYLVPRAWYK